MAGPRRTLDEYIADRVQQLTDLGGVLGPTQVNEGKTDAVLMSSVRCGDGEDAVLTVFEHLKLVRGRPHRFKYSYQGSVGTELIFRYDRDPVVHSEMPEHKHLPGGRRVAWDRVTLHDAAEELWDAIAEREPAEG
jgi:hypothetical protein